MRRPNLLYPLLLFAALLAGSCTQEPLSGTDETSGATLYIRLAPRLEAETRGDSDSEAIAALWYAVANADGGIIDPLHHRLADDCSKLTIEGLKQGDYRILLLATTDPAAAATVAEPASLNDTWLQAAPDRNLLDETWFYRQVDLHIDAAQQPVAREIVLERCVGRVDVDVQLESPYLEGLIRKVEVVFDPASRLYTSLTAGGSCRDTAAPGTLDLTASRSFRSLPSQTALAGSVRITAARSNGETFERSFSFADCRIEAGKITRIAVEFHHPEEEEGTLHIGEADFARFRTDTMFLAREPREVFYDPAQRSFYPNRPLQAAIDAEHRLQLRFFSPVPIRNVSLRCRFNRVSTEFFELARFDIIYPFLEAAFPLPVTTGAKRFTAADGRRIVVPAQPELADDDVTFDIVCDDPFMQKIAAINSNWYVYFSPFQADEGHAYWRHMDPELCRHGVALALNMAYMFATPEFNAQLEHYKGKLLDNTGNAIDPDQLRQLIRDHNGLTLGHVTGVGGLGGGRTYGLADYCYREVYWDWEQNPLANPHTYVRQAMFHEYGHCLGYSHDSTMTYGDQWTVLCAEVFVELGYAGRLPVGSKSIIADLPM